MANPAIELKVQCYWRVSRMIAGQVAQARRREESPDTTLRKQSRATRLVTPGELL
jgi:hypothetical protein